MKNNVITCCVTNKTNLVVNRYIKLMQTPTVSPQYSLQEI